ncbi:2-amino-4-hydroxy-6-hydroxymethyldihydropteridine diphosphokinase [Tepidibacillus marianensis]|uniref:2-amino-4-hydroxy-6- hydroxymethyldihydropteridine diphosphokinase n=1 Tax=Tepidibacillus marianensis TaxID=3131995 RepID=UPI0030D1D626
MTEVYLGLGSNIGSREEYLRQAIGYLQCHPQINIMKRSSIYETEPFGYKEQPYFLNMVVQIETDLNPDELLESTQKIEYQLGRKREVHWGPRTIDIDLLLYGKEIIKTPFLTIPHLYLTERLFVLKPLSEVYRGKIPGEQRTISTLINQLSSGSGGVNLWKTSIEE